MVTLLLTAFRLPLIFYLKPLKAEDPPGAIIVFSHGHDRSGNDPRNVADEAAKRNIKIHTIGVGTHGNNFSEDVLQVVADITGGNYYPIYSSGDLLKPHCN